MTPLVPHKGNPFQAWVRESDGAVVNTGVRISAPPPAQVVQG